MELSGAKRVQVLVGILFAVILAGLDNTIVGTVMPTAIGELGRRDLYAWTFAAYMLATAVSMPLWGPGSDRWGRKRTFLTGIAVFTFGSALCAVAPTMPLFIAARAFQGIGAGAVSSLPFIILGVVFPPHMRGKALGVTSSAWAIASVAGPLMGASIVSFTSWRWAFLINVPIALIAATLILLAMPESHGEREGRFDLAGALCAGIGGSFLIWAFVDMGEGTFGGFEYALVAAGLVLLGLFVWVESRAAKPILPLDLFRQRGYAVSMATSLLLFFTAFGISAYLPLHASAVLGAPSVGWVVGTFTIGWSGCAFLAGRLVHRAGERLLGVTGVAIHIAGFLALVFAFDHGLLVACLAAGICGAGTGLASPGLTVVVQNSVKVQRIAGATTSQQFVRQISAALGVSCFVLLAGLHGFAWGLYAFAIVAGIALLLVALLPAHSLKAAGAGAAVHATEL